MSVAQWSQTAATNANVDPAINWAEGQSPRTVNDSARAMMAAVAKWRDDHGGSLTTAGTAAAFTITTNQSIGALASTPDGFFVVATMHTRSGAAPTLSVDGRTAAAITLDGATAIPAGYLPAGTVVAFAWDATASVWVVPGRAFGFLGFLPEEIKTADYTVVAYTDAGKALVANKATAITFSLPAVASAGNCPVLVRNIGVGALTLDPSGSETIEGATTLVLLTGDAALIWCNGSTWRAFKSLVPRDFTPSGIMAPHGSHRAPSGWLKCDGTSYLAATYPNLFAAIVAYSTATITIGTNAAVTWASHGLVAGDPVKFTTTGALPTGLTAGTTYYVSATNLTTNTFCVSATSGGATITTSGTQSGTHTAINAPWGCTNDLLSFNVPEVRGEFLRGLDDGRGIDTNRSMGSWQDSDNKAHTHSVPLGAGASIGGGGGGGTYLSGGPVTSGSSGGTEARPRNVAVLWIIKT
ncbi:phage tail protein [Xanthobacter versatilis]|uniref:phage tail protein n=1 Tax=Xanthobacter autotrophicus (strain ATCC BAA-1158 / Py2) TaxID=78245 RepID=UPI00372C026B